MKYLLILILLTGCSRSTHFPPEDEKKMTYKTCMIEVYETNHLGWNGLSDKEYAALTEVCDDYK